MEFRPDFRPPKKDPRGSIIAIVQLLSGLIAAGVLGWLIFGG